MQDSYQGRIPLWRQENPLYANALSLDAFIRGINAWYPNTLKGNRQKTWGPS